MDKRIPAGWTNPYAGQKNCGDFNCQTISCYDHGQEGCIMDTHVSGVYV